MTYENRGTIEYHDRLEQIISFDGIKFVGNITPTDVDAAIEYHEKAYVFCEYKHRNAKITDGQRKFLERMANDLQRSKKATIVLIARHDVDDPKQDVVGAIVPVSSLYYKGKWHDYAGRKTVKEVIDNFLKKVDEGTA